MRDTRIDLVSAGSTAGEAVIMVDLAWEGAVQAGLRRAKIICTIGPASTSEAAMRDLMRPGMDVARLNFSHGTQREHARNIPRLGRAAKKEQRTISILQGLERPKIRSGRLKGDSPIPLEAGSGAAQEEEPSLIVGHWLLLKVLGISQPPTDQRHTV